MLRRLWTYLPLLFMAVIIVVGLPNLRESWWIIAVVAVIIAELAHQFGLKAIPAAFQEAE